MNLLFFEEPEPFRSYRFTTPHGLEGLEYSAFTKRDGRGVMSIEVKNN
jgi:hypothetical protein